MVSSRAKRDSGMVYTTPLSSPSRQKAGGGTLPGTVTGGVPRLWDLEACAGCADWCDAGEAAPGRAELLEGLDRAQTA